MENKTKTKFIFLITGIIGYLVFLIYYINGSYPWIGHDNTYFFPWLYDTYIHYLKNGLTIQWFTPSFGGGLPAYHNPQQIQFSLTQFLVFLFNPWISIQITIAVYSVIGYIFAYRFARDILNLKWQASILGSLFFISGGFYIQHMAVGQLSFALFPLASLIFYFLFSQRRPAWFNSMIAGLAIALTFHSGGIYILVVFGLCFLILTPFVYILSPTRFDLKKFFITGLICALTASLISAGKLFAVISFIQHFPRDLYVDHEFFAIHSYSYFSALVRFLIQFIGIPIFSIPINILIDDKYATVNMVTNLVNGIYIWESDTSISLLLIVVLFRKILLIPKLAISSFRNQTNFFSFAKRKIAAGIILGFAAWFAFEFTSRHGILYDIVRNLPILQSLNFNTRYGASFLFPLAILGAYFINSDFKRLSIKKQTQTFYLYFLITLVSLNIYFLVPFDSQYRNYNVESALKTYDAIRTGEEMFVEKISPVKDSEAFLEHASSQIAYEPIFGYWQEQFTPKTVGGPIEMVDGQYYNMTNPNSLVYDTEELWARFTLDEKDKMLQFANYQQPEWDIPPIQHTLNAISSISFFGVIIVLIGYYLFERKNNEP